MAERVSLDNVQCPVRGHPLQYLAMLQTHGNTFAIPQSLPPPLIYKHLGCSKNAQLYAIKEDFHYNGLDTNTITNHEAIHLFFGLFVSD